MHCLRTKALFFFSFFFLFFFFFFFLGGRGGWREKDEGGVGGAGGGGGKLQQFDLALFSNSCKVISLVFPDGLKFHLRVNLSKVINYQLCLQLKRNRDRGKVLK